MTIPEFTNHTGVFPDFALYQAACQEYEKKKDDGSPVWDSQAQFCAAYQYNEDGLAEEIQTIANKKWGDLEAENNRLRTEITPITDKCERLRAQNSKLKEENENLRAELSALTDRVDKLSAMLGNPTEMLETTENDALTRMKADMFNSLLEAAHEGHNGKTVLHMVFGFDFLLAQIACGGVADD